MIYLDESRRDEAIDAGWEAYKDQFPDLEYAHRKLASEWQVIAVCSDDEVIGALFAKDGIIHLGIIHNWRKRWASRRIIRDMLRYGRKTEVLPGGERFIERIGFVKKNGIYEIG